MRTLDRYLLRSFFSNYLLSLFVLISLYVVLDLFINFDEFTKQGKPVGTVIGDIINYYSYNMPLYFSQMSGVITLFAACGTFARLQRQNEITAVLASGTSLYRLAAPIVLAGLAMNGLLMLDQEVILPYVAPQLARDRDDIEGAKVHAVWFVRDGDSRLLTGLQFSPAQKKIRNLIVMELSKDPLQKGKLSEVLLADKAEWNGDRGGWDLKGGKRVGMVADQTGMMTLDQAAKPVPVQFYATDLTPDELKLRQTTQWVQFLSVRQLSQLAARGEANPMQIAQIKHSRFTMPINNMILLLLGISFFMNRLPTGVLSQGAQALAMCSTSFLITFIGQQMVGAVDLPPALSALPAWLPIFFFGPVAVVLLDNVKT